MVTGWGRVLAPMEMLTPPGMVIVAGWLFGMYWITVWIGVATGVKVTGIVAVKVGEEVAVRVGVEVNQVPVGVGVKV